MTKLSYYAAVAQDNTKSLWYGQSKLEVIGFGENNGGPFTDIKELTLSEAKTDYGEKEMDKARKFRKENRIKTSSIPGAPTKVKKETKKKTKKE